MKVLYVVGACLTKNTSANMSHNGYVQGLLENGCRVDILMADGICVGANAVVTKSFTEPGITIAGVPAVRIK